MNEDVKKAVIFLIVFMIIAVLWEFIDILEFGKPQPSISDSIFGLILTNMICKSLRWQKKGREQNK